MALAARVTGLDQVRVYALLGDGECNEGQIWEAAMAAAHHRAGNLFGVLDRNQMSLDGPTEEVMGIEPVADKWRAFGWEVREADGHDPDAVAAALLDPGFAGVPRPHLLICHTVKGKGVSFMEGGREWHLGYLAPADRERVLAELAKAAEQ
jgi:transketolase